MFLEAGYSGSVVHCTGNFNSCSVQENLELIELTSSSRNLALENLNQGWMFFPMSQADPMQGASRYLSVFQYTADAIAEQF